jgi:3'(2'), 5'-bisphosphate nucleotidase
MARRSELEMLVESAAAAAHVVREVYERGFAVTFKGLGDPVTDADRRSNALLVERLQSAFPGVPVVSEESDSNSFRDFRRAERVLFVDPLDGTREFIERNSEFVVMIGLVVGRGAVAGGIDAPDPAPRRGRVGAEAENEPISAVITEDRTALDRYIQRRRRRNGGGS